MRIRALNSQSDWLFGANQNSYVVGQAAVAEQIQTRLLSFLGDCFFDTGSGINWFGYFQQKDTTALALAINATILNTQDSAGNQLVTGVIQASSVLNPLTRNLTVNYKVITVYSVLTSSFSYDLGAID